MYRGGTALLLLLAAPVAASAAPAALDWREIYTQDEVTVSKATVPGTSLVAFKGDTVMAAPIGKVLHVLIDHQHPTEWVDRLYLSRVVSEASAFDYVMYQAYELPAVLSNRDYVFRSVGTTDAAGAVTLAMESVEVPGAPETVGVRARLVNSRYQLTPLGPDRTRVEVEILTDPMGAMPVWLVNLIQRSWPLDTLNGVRAQLGKSWVVDHPLP
jgi:START domain